MTDFSFQQKATATASSLTAGPIRNLIPAGLALLAILASVSLLLSFQRYSIEEPALIESTLGELAVWMTDQSAEEAPESLLGQYAKSWALQTGDPALDPAVLLVTVHRLLVLWAAAIILLAALGLIGLILNLRWGRAALMAALFAAVALLFVVPAANAAVGLIMLDSLILIAALILAPGRLDRVLSFIIVMSMILLAWEASKALAQAWEYDITVPAAGWDYRTFGSLDEALDGLKSGEVNAVIADRSDVRDLIAPYPADDGSTDATELSHSELRYLANLNTDQAVLGIFPYAPDYPGRLSVIVPANQADQVTHINQVLAMPVGAVAGDFAEERYLSAERNLVLLDLKILNDINLPHLQNIASALLQPARRNGPLLLIRILSDAAIHTWGEALLGFAFGATLGLLLGSLFAHSLPMERGLLPYVVASQTVPILAIAPMVVIWLGAGPLAVAIISAYLTFFPVTINTLRGLRSPHPNALELLQSYAASRWEIMWKLRFPAALPYIFTALKVSATASVVGAIIGELPSSIRDGLGRAILDFSSDYSLVSTPKLWAAILVAASIGIISFLLVSLVEHVVLGRYAQNG